MGPRIAGPQAQETRRKKIISKFNYLDYSSYPVEILEQAKIHLKEGKMLTDFNSGSYALWALYPKFKTGIDGRYEEVFSQATFDLVAEAYDNSQPEKQEKALAIINPDYILYKGKEIEVSDMIRALGFKVILSDDNYLILARIINMENT